MVSSGLNRIEGLGHDGDQIRDHKLTERQTRQLKKPVHNAREVAEIVAVQALSFLAGDPERLGAFLSESGIGPETLRNAAADPHFLASVLDFVLRDDATVKAFASVSQLHPTNIAAARQALGDPHWERDVP
jgi:Protein of unknown function (DUF3572)